MAFDRDEYLRVKRPLRFHRDGGFRILILADPHGGTASHPQLMRGVDAIIDAANPDLILFAGDLTGCRIGCGTQEELRAYIERLTALPEKRGIPWAHVFGNHDADLGVSNDAQQAVLERFPHCVSKRGPADVYGVSNYVLPILHSDRDEPAFNVWGIDSNNDNKAYCRAVGLPEDTRFVLPEHFCMGYHSDAPHTDQVLWYYQTSAALERAFGGKVPGILCLHIPLPEFCLIPRNPSQTHMRGVMREHVCCNELNTGLFAACLQRGDIRGIFAGHDHLNDYCGEYCGVTLGACAGINYDCGSADEARGGRVVDLKESDVWGGGDTYMLRLCDLMGAQADNRGRP